MLKSRRWLVLLLAASLAAGLCSGCVPSAGSQGGTVAAVDAAGAEVELPKNPQRVAVLFSSLADIWVTAGGTVAVTVGESVERGFAGEDAVLVDSGAGKSIDTERVIDAGPDLVLCSADIEAQCDAAEICRQAGIPTAALRVECFEDYLDVLHLFTELTGESGRYETYGTQVQARIEALKESFAGSAQAQKILFIRAGSTAGATKAKTAREHFACAMLQELGTENIADQAPVLLDGLSFEEVLRQDPDCIFIATMGDERAAKDYMNSVLAEPAWQSLTAVQQGRVAYLPKELFQYKPNARWDEAYEYLIDLLTADVQP